MVAKLGRVAGVREPEARSGWLRPSRDGGFQKIRFPGDPFADT
jgi:hypothetical protein